MLHCGSHTTAVPAAWRPKPGIATLGYGKNLVKVNWSNGNGEHVEGKLLGTKMGKTILSDGSEETVDRHGCAEGG